MCGVWSPRVPTPKRLLIIEEEALIALDVQQVIELGLDGRATVTRDYEEASGLVGPLAELSLAVITPPRTPADRAFAGKLIQAGVAVVVCSASMTDLSGTPLAGSPIVNKPFTDDEILAACREALADKCVSSACGS